MTDDVAQRLLEAIAAERLLVVCGAGLSMAPPSNLPSASVLARACSEAYRNHTGTSLDETIQDDIAAISRHFLGLGRFENFFITTLVPWADLNGEPNDGHEALADLLACHVLAGAFTTNFDALLERAARRIGERDFRAIVDAEDIAQHTPHRSYLKLHGCADRSRRSTIWCPDQLADPTIATRIEPFRHWLATNLNGRDLVFVGFWTDWSCLTDLIAGHFGQVRPGHVYLVDPASEADLQRKAPRLWDWVRRDDVAFHHCQESATDFLDELRRRWSLTYVDRLLRDSEATYVSLFRTAASGGDTADFRRTPPFDSSALYALRRDLSGTPRGTVVRGRHPEEADHVAGAIHRRLLERGADYSAHMYTLGQRTIRLVSGRGRLLSQVKAAFTGEPPAPTPADEVVCAGSIPDASPANIVRAETPTTVVRTGVQNNWRDHTTLVTDLRMPRA